MKIRWRQHEFLLMLLFAVISMAGYLWHMKNLTESQINRIYGQPFLDTQTGSFTYFRNVLLLQVGTIVLLFLCYQWIRKSIAPRMVLQTRGAATGSLVKRYLWMAVQVLMIAFLLGPFMNMIYFEQNRFHYRYPNDTFLPILGTHPQPASNMLGGLGIVLAPLLLYIAYVWIREQIISNIERNENTYAARIVNQVTLFLLIYFSIITIIATFNLSSVYALRVLFYAIVPSAFLVFMANAYWIFPLRDSKSMVSPRTALYLLVSTLLLVIPFITIPAVDSAERVFLISLAVQLLVVTPLSWIYYQKRKDELAVVREVPQVAPALAVQGIAAPVNMNTQWLYTTLNELCNTALQDGSEQTAEGIQKLGNMMAPMLNEDRESFISLREEVKNLKTYINLKKLRIQYSSNIQVEDNIANQQTNHPIAPMLLLPLVENAFKGGTNLDQKSRISISLTSDEKYIYFETRHTVHPKTGNGVVSEEKNNAIAQVATRLQQIYPGKSQFNHWTEGNESIVQLTIQAPLLK